MDIYRVCILFSSLSFFFYSYYYFISPRMKQELDRMGVSKLGLFITTSQFLGACGLLIGLEYNLILILASLGLATLMFCGFLVRMKSKDGLWLSLPALFYLILNSYIFIKALAIWIRFAYKKGTSSFTFFFKTAASKIKSCRIILCTLDSSKILNNSTWLI